MIIPLGMNWGRPAWIVFSYLSLQKSDLFSDDFVGELRMLHIKRGNWRATLTLNCDFFKKPNEQPQVGQHLFGAALKRLRSAQTQELCLQAAPRKGNSTGQTSHSVEVSRTPNKPLSFKAGNVHSVTWRHRLTRERWLLISTSSSFLACFYLQ